MSNRQEAINWLKEESDRLRDDSQYKPLLQIAIADMEKQSETLAMLSKVTETLDNVADLIDEDDGWRMQNINPAKVLPVLDKAIAYLERRGKDAKKE